MKEKNIRFLRILNMSQKLNELKTGIKSLDDDLRELFGICEDKKKLSVIKKAIAKKDISSEEFSKIVPESLIRLSFVLTGPPQFVLLLEQINEEAVSLVEEAKSLIEEHFGSLVQNKNAKSIFKKIIKEGEQEESLADKVIRGVKYYFVWEGEPPELTPAVRVALVNRKRKILLDTGLDWEDFSLLLKNLSEIFVELLEKGKPLAESGQVDLSDSKEASESIEKALASLKKIKKIMHIYKAKTETDNKKQSVKNSSN